MEGGVLADDVIDQHKRVLQDRWTSLLNEVFAMCCLRELDFFEIVKEFLTNAKHQGSILCWTWITMEKIISFYITPFEGYTFNIEYKYKSELKRPNWKKEGF